LTTDASSLAAGFAADRQPPNAKRNTTTITSHGMELSLAVCRDSAEEDWSIGIKSAAAK
jgi:hypothetical protein